ncbi:hypothetical protein SteCoe_38816 [Stentor coeruleus]|uniref:Protein kinase domain-containing protein n=1 Tax=Stentor coeruleus TaxID=5963 RepID=A0A1R2AL23_9CILI|nr:hypothetical protein SteCoe_38816 [Stentor coeruleus]
MKAIRRDCIKYQINNDDSQTCELPMTATTQSEERYHAPEIANRSIYYKSYHINPSSFSYNISDSWSLAATILNIMDDKNIDKWNKLNFKNNLLSIVQGVKKENTNLSSVLSRSLDVDFSNRLHFAIALQELERQN